MVFAINTILSRQSSCFHRRPHDPWALRKINHISFNLRPWAWRGSFVFARALLPILLSYIGLKTVFNVAVSKHRQVRKEEKPRTMPCTAIDVDLKVFNLNTQEGGVCFVQWNRRGFCNHGVHQIYVSAYPWTH